MVSDRRGSTAIHCPTRAWRVENQVLGLAAIGLWAHLPSQFARTAARLQTRGVQPGKGSTMQGMLLGLVRETLVKRYGRPMWDSLVAAEETHLCECLDAAGDGVVTDLPSDALVCWLARQSVSTLRDTYPSLFGRYTDLVGFVRGLGDELPVAAHRESDRSRNAKFSYRDTPDGDLLVRIEAESPICALIEGVIAGAARYYDEKVTIEELKCRKRGDNACVIRIAFVDAPLAADIGPAGPDLRAAGGV